MELQTGGNIHDERQIIPTDGEERKNHSITLSQREKLDISGVKEVLSFDENQVVMDTWQGLLAVDGRQLHVSKLDTVSGDVVISGRICGIIYQNDPDESGSRPRKRLFR